eukprot:gnl/TRDRNA2_/TRDRNA2_150298_c0_seq2.p1 gnl/TRDRNA2_/TRDRNA2_150298_c0~~gnl/TRDRNA2_/TRDRNA2_150298_c0_seq2.p1  ORF type:complete len:316 (-),score=20.13 gnl/TRDRNA2_/TRDRNA2_150298_c0_seq2:237-1184(-)
MGTSGAMLFLALGLHTRANLALRVWPTIGMSQHADPNGELWANPTSGMKIESVKMQNASRKARIVHGRFALEGQDRKGQDRSGRDKVLVVDGVSSWLEYGKGLHHNRITSDQNWRFKYADDLSKTPNCANCRDSHHGDTQLFKSFKSDAEIRAIMQRHYGVNSSRCVFERDPHVFHIVQNASMSPDTWHTDICEDTVGKNWLGMTLITYPNDRWSPEWQGHFELAGPRQQTVARIAPLPNRSIIFPGCLVHRATNPLASASPVDSQMLVSTGFSNLLGNDRNEASDHFDFHGFRFAQVVQMSCLKTGFMQWLLDS